MCFLQTSWNDLTKTRILLADLFHIVYLGQRTSSLCSTYNGGQRRIRGLNHNSKSLVPVLQDKTPIAPFMTNLICQECGKKTIQLYEICFIGRAMMEHSGHCNRHLLDFSFNFESYRRSQNHLIIRLSSAVLVLRIQHRQIYERKREHHFAVLLLNRLQMIIVVFGESP